MGAVSSPSITTDSSTLDKIERRMQQEGCPAARRLSLAAGGFNVICGVIERENRETKEQVSEHVDPLVTERADPSTIHGYCTTRGYGNCPVWRTEVARREKDADRIDAVDINYGGGVANRL